MHRWYSFPPLHHSFSLAPCANASSHAGHCAFGVDTSDHGCVSIVPPSLGLEVYEVVTAMEIWFSNSHLFSFSSLKSGSWKPFSPFSPFTVLVNMDLNGNFFLQNLWFLEFIFVVLWLTEFMFTVLLLR